MSDPKWCRTTDGKEINLFDPDLALFTVDRIANALARINRFAGHWERPVSVARHSIFVAELLRAAGHDVETRLQVPRRRGSLYNGRSFTHQGSPNHPFGRCGLRGLPRV
jgi:hypothetical protein